MKVDLLCVGHAAYDLSMHLAEYPRENTKAEIHDLAASGGGPAANAAYLNSLWGLSAAFAGLIGADSYGQAIRDEFIQVGTNTTLLEMRAGHSTPFSVILVNAENGSRTIINRKTPHVPFCLNPAAVAGLDPTCLLFDGHELAASLDAMQRWPDAISILDAGSKRPGTLELAGRVDYLVASERFTLQVTKEANLSDETAKRRALASLKEHYETNVVITMGEKGLMAEDQGEYRHLPAFPVQAIDTTGAGDIFHGAFAHGCVIGLALWENLRRASMAAALSVQTRGGRQSMPTRRQVEEALTHAH